MAVGINVVIPNGTHRVLYGPFGVEVPSMAFLNPNDGVCYIARNRDIADINTASWDYKVPSQSYGLFPGPWINVGVWYQDQSGAGRNGEITVYSYPQRVHAPDIRAIGRALSAQSTSMDITQGGQPANPPAGVTRLWIDSNGDLWMLQPNGTNIKLADYNDALDGVLTGLLPNPGMAAGAAAANVGTLGGVLTGLLPNPGMAGGVITDSNIAPGGLSQTSLAPNAALNNIAAGSITSLKLSSYAASQFDIGFDSSGQAMSSGTAAYIPGSTVMSINISPDTRDVVVWGHATFSNPTVPNAAALWLGVDGAFTPFAQCTLVNSGGAMQLAFLTRPGVSVGTSHTFGLGWSTSAGSLQTIAGITRAIGVLQLKR